MIKYIGWFYGRTRDGETLHLVRYKDGSGILYTDEEMVSRGLADWIY